MFRNLKAEMVRKNISTEKIAEALGISQRTVFNKMNGGTEFTLKEIIKTQKTFFPDCTIDYLFATESEV